MKKVKGEEVPAKSILKEPTLLRLWATVLKMSVYWSTLLGDSAVDFPPHQLFQEDTDPTGKA